MPLSIKDIKLLVMDVDGVLTDGGLIIHDDGSESKRFHVHDGGWIRIWQRLGFKTAIITGRQCHAVDHRMTDLQIDYVYQKAHDKREVLETLIADSGIAPEQMAYVGDDVFDLPVMSRVAYPVAVANAIPELKEISQYVTTARGGDGAVGELIRHLIKEKGLWDQAMAKYRQ